MRAVSVMLLTLLSTPQALAQAPDPQADCSPPSASTWFCAGFGIRDITPPPGLGLAGHGPEGERARGWRLRLQARALVVRDPSGEALALVQVDLPHTSALLQHAVASEVQAYGVELGADRIVLVATHTHSGPGHFYDAQGHNRQVSQVPGFDSVFVRLLAHRIAAAIHDAIDSLEPAQLRLTQVPAWGAARIRSLPAYRKNDPPYVPPVSPPVSLDAAYASINPMVTVVRVDRIDPRSGLPKGIRGALMIFGIHGTGNTPSNQLYDSDVHGRVARLVDSILKVQAARDYPGTPAGPRPITVFLNGPLGDVSPGWPEDSRCDPPRLVPRRAEAGLRSLAVNEWLPDPPATLARCAERARGGIEQSAHLLAQAVGSAFAKGDSLGAHPEPAPRVRRAFDVVPLTGPLAPLGLCPDPVPGTATVGGAPDGRTRYAGWRFLGIFPSGLEEGGHAIRKPPEGCHAEKQVALGRIAGPLLVGKHGFPEEAQLTVARIGRLVLATTPAEVTTTAGARIAEAVRDALTSVHEPQSLPPLVLVLSHTNGFLQYLTTPEEYSAQYYEGSSTLYGPGEARAITGELVRLARSLGPDGAPSPVPLHLTISSHPGPSKPLLPWQASQPDQTPPHDVRARCLRDTLEVTWRAPAPIASWPADTARITFRPIGDTAQSAPRVVTDDDPRVEVTVDGTGGNARWRTSFAHPDPGPVRIVVTGTVAQEQSESWDCSQASDRSWRSQ